LRHTNSDRSKEVGTLKFVKEDPIKTYDLEYSTKYACPTNGGGGGGGGSDDDDGGISGGWIFIIMYTVPPPHICRYSRIRFFGALRLPLTVSSLSRLCTACRACSSST
jgi:hypothetical protein